MVDGSTSGGGGGGGGVFPGAQWGSKPKFCAVCFLPPHLPVSELRRQGDRHPLLFCFLTQTDNSTSQAVSLRSTR